jgi:hypothetical protein
MMCGGDDIPISEVECALASAALTADRNRLPTQFVGDWCRDKPGNDQEAPTYRLGCCLPYQNNSSDAWLTARSDGFAAHETRFLLFSDLSSRANEVRTPV